MIPENPRLIVIVPTRNRADIAINATRSLLACADQSLLVLLSDNSTIAAHSEGLERFKESRADDRLILRRPPHPMSMTDHWDWVLTKAVDESLATHVVVLTDRMMFKYGSLSSLLAILARHPDQIISYAHDRVVDHVRPIAVELTPWSDEVIQLSAVQLLSLSSQGFFPWALPRLLNSVVPRSLLEAMRIHYGSFVGSISPDYSFCYRSLALVDSIAYWDRAPTIHYSLDQSNGHSFSRGVSTAASADFISMIRGTIFASAPIPGIRTGGNAMLHEYCVARDESKSNKFPDINLDAYTKLIRQDIVQLENRDLAKEVSAQLQAWLVSTGRTDSFFQRTLGRESILRRLLRRWDIGPSLLRLRRRFSIVVGRSPARPEFPEATEALEFALSHNGERLPVARLTSLFTS